MKKKVVFVGGHHGAGKSALCAAVAASRGFVQARQRHMLMDVGASKGLLRWEEIGSRHEEFLPEVIVAFVDRLANAESDVMLVDCHYAIRSAKALRLNGRAVEEPYVHDLDPRLVRALATEFSTGFVLVSAGPEATIDRLERCDASRHGPDYRPLAIREQMAVERAFLVRLAGVEALRGDRIFSLDNAGSLDASVQAVTRFIEHL